MNTTHYLDNVVEGVCAPVMGISEIWGPTTLLELHVNGVNMPTNVIPS